MSLACTLCASPAKRRLTAANIVLPFCDVCLGALTEPDSDAGRVLRRAARGIARKAAMALPIDKLTTPTYRASVRAAATRYRRAPENQAKIDARTAVRFAVKRGELVRPSACSSCGDKPEPTRDGRPQIWFCHTNGYDKRNWLTGEWLCRNCSVAMKMGAAA